MLLTKYFESKYCEEHAQIYWMFNSLSLNDEHKKGQVNGLFCVPFVASYLSNKNLSNRKLAATTEKRASIIHIALIRRSERFKAFYS